MRRHWITGIGAAVLAIGLATTGAASAAPPPSSPSQAHACGAPGAQQARCGAIQLLDPSQNWHPGHSGQGPGGGGSTFITQPSSGYYPGDLQSAYGLAGATAAFGPGPSAPTVAVVDAYDDPNAASDLATYRANLSKATDPTTGITGSTIPPLCSSTVTTGCVTFAKVNQSGGTSYPRGDTGWAEEISLDLDMISAVCPNCNVLLVEATSNSFSNLAAAAAYAQTQHPAAITNSYGGGESSSETSYNSTYSATSSTAVTAATGDNGYGVEFPAASPGLTAVGGTSLTYSGGTWSQTAWSGAGSGCSAYESIPSWQNDQGVYRLSADCSGRQVGDVSAVADPSTGVAVYDSYGQLGWLVFGGTSASTQIIGATYGDAAGSGSIQGKPGGLYPDVSGGSGPTLGLLPVTSGSNGNCGDYLCNAGDHLSSGYNGPTGLGTPYGIGAFEASTSTSPDFTLSATPGSATVTQGNSTSYTVSVTPSGGFNSAVSLSVTGSPSGATVTLSNTSVSSSSSPPWSSTITVTTTGTTPTGTDTLAITGTSGSLTHTANVTLVVQSPQTAKTMTVTVTAGSLVRRFSGYQVPLTVKAADASSGTAVGGANVVLQVFQGSTCSGTVAASGSGTTGTNGQVGFTFSTRNAANWCALATVTESGYSAGSGRTTFAT